MEINDAFISQLLSAPPEVISEVLAEMPEDDRVFLEDQIALARAKTDKFSRIEYFLKDDKGRPIKLYSAHRLMIDFAYTVWEEGYTPIIFAFVGSGKTTIFAGGVLPDMVGLNQNIRSQIVCASDTEATKRVRIAKTVLNSRHYQKLYPHITPAQPWTDHQAMVARTKNADVADESMLGEALSVDPTISAFGVGGSALGTRTEFTLGDDLANEENAILHPDEGDKVYSTINSKFLSRRVAPIGKADEDYDSSQDPTKFVFLGNTWHENDAIYRMINEPRKCAILIGVNDDLESYNVRIYGCLSEKAMADLKEKYAIGECEDGLEPDKPAKCSFRIKADLPKAYLEARREETTANGKWNPTFRTIVFTDSQRAYSNCENSFVYGVDRELAGRNGGFVDWTVDVKELFVKRGDKDNLHLGWKASVKNPPKGIYTILNIDFSGMKREGTILMVGTMLPNFKRVPIAIYSIAADGGEQPDIIKMAFEDYPEIAVWKPEDAGLQLQTVSAWMKSPEKYGSWIYKCEPFENHGGKRKNDQQLGVLAMATSLANAGFMIADTTQQPHHPRKGDAKKVKGCECGYCRLIRDLKTQTRMAEVKSDLIMTLWMQDRSFPEYVELPDGVEAGGIDYVKSGLELAAPKEQGVFGDYLLHGKDTFNERTAPPLITAFKEEDIEKDSEGRPLAGKKHVVLTDGRRMSSFD